MSGAPEVEKPCLGVIILPVIFMNNTVLILSLTVYKIHFFVISKYVSVLNNFQPNILVVSWKLLTKYLT